MAITKIGPPLAGLRGTIGGITYSENGSGTYAKQWATPSNPRTSKQSEERSHLSQMPLLWNALTGVEKAAWNTFAALAAQELFNSLGESYYASGWNWFCKCNIRLLRVGRATIEPVPTQARPGAPTIDAFRVCQAGSDPDLCTGGTPTASSSHVATPPARAFDDNIATWWQSDNLPWPQWIEYEMPAAHVITKYSLTALDAPTILHPKAWTFQRWNGAAWDDIQAVTNAPAWGLSEQRDYYVPIPPATETEYRIHFTANQIAGQGAAVAEIQFFAASLDNSVIIYPEDDFADTPDYDLILHVAPGVSTGKQVQYPGFAEILALQDPERHAENIQDELEATFGTILDDRAWFAQLYRQTAEGIRSTADTERTETI